jgi:RNA polymerase sigma-70 factor (ECF subfamily)
MGKSYTTYTDDALFALLSGSHAEAEAAFTVLYERYAPRIHAYCLRVVGSECQAEDVFQETFVRFFKSAQKKRQPSSEREHINVAGFLLTIARNLCLNHKRDRRATIPLEEFVLPRVAANNYEEEELLGLITTALELLDTEHREAFVLREYDGLPYHEIAALIGCNEATARTRVFRAKQRLRHILSPYVSDLAK